MPSFATIDRSQPMTAILKVVGVGGGGCNAVESMIKRGLNGVEYVAVNTDAQVLEKSNAQHKVQIGVKITKGLGAGADPKIGKKAAEEDREKIAEILSGSDMVFITTGMGGGTGTGAAPVVASIAKSLGALVVGVVTKPFKWEGRIRTLNAESGIQELKQFVDSLIVIPNERILAILDKNTPASSSFDKPNEVLYEATRGIADIITIPGIINVDFADVRTVMNQSGVAVMGCGIASGEHRAIEAAQKAISSPLLDGVSIQGAKNVLINVTGSDNLTMMEIHEGNNIIQQTVGEEANIIFGYVTKEDMNDYVSYTVIATGFDKQNLMGSQKPAEKKVVNPPKSTPIHQIFSGYTADNNLVDKDDLNIPTIFRKGTKDSSVSQFQFEANEEEENFSSGFSTEKIKQYSLEQNRKEEAKVIPQHKNIDEEDSSAFLRMIMD
ncbi:MAG TPA: cell division protein FtsZ [Bacteroidetes bacterium]|nr:cell division protein FtsZ [Ignavibacteriaceae bacterium]HAY33676.1 cell division protein FtsZ [Bacteroidota bacterium]HRI46625.1 cell division protein FtsZ [Ignavibacteriaceae bacterium]